MDDLPDVLALLEAVATKPVGSPEFREACATLKALLEKVDEIKPDERISL